MQVSGKIKGTLLLLILVASMPVFFVNGKSVVEEKITTDAGPKDWTVLVYMCADNNLEYFGLEDIDEMEAAGGTTADVNVVAMVDRCAYDYETAYGGTNGWSESRYYTITYDIMTNSIGSTMNVSLGEQNMGQSQTLDDFIDWGLTNYPADKTALILWDHGGGLDGVCWDEDNGDDNLLVDELDIALEGYYFDIIGMDACVMGQTEVLYEMKDHCDYYISSMENEPGYGWDYYSSLSSLIATPSMSAADFAIDICEDYLSFYLGIGYPDPVTLSAYNTTAMVGFETLFNDFATELTDALVSNANDIYNVRQETNSQLFPDVMCDMKEFVEGVALLPIPSLSSAASALDTMLDDMLLVSESTYVTDPYGLWFFLPAFPYEYHNDIYINSNQTTVGSLFNHYYDFEFVENTDWDNFLDDWKVALESEITDLVPVSPYTDTAVQGDVISFYADLPDPGEGYAHTATLSFGASLDYDLFAWSEEYYFNLPNGFQIASAAYGSDPEEILIAIDDATRVFFYVNAYDGTGSYTLELDLVEYSDDVYEENDDIGSAASLELNTVHSLICGDDDFFAVDLISGSSVDIYLNFDNVATDLDLHLAENDGTVVAESLNYYTDEHISYTPSYTGVYYILVNYWDGVIPAPYTLEVSVNENPVITSLYNSPSLPEPGESITIYCAISAMYPIVEVTLAVSYDGGAEQYFAMTEGGVYYTVVFAAPEGVDEIEYTVYVEDDQGNSVTSDLRAIKIDRGITFTSAPWIIAPILLLGLAGLSVFLKRKR